MILRNGPRALRGIRCGATALALVALCATCDASTALAPAQLRAVALSWDGDTLLVAGATMPAPVSVTVDGAPHDLARVRLTSSQPDVVAVGADGRSLEGRRVGSAVITAELLDASLPSPAPSIAITIRVSPASLQSGALPDTIRSIGDTVRLSATPVDAAGRAIADVPVSWSSSAPGIATIDASGLVTARGNGDVVVQAEAGGARLSASLTVRQRPASIRFSIPSLRLDALGADTTLSATTLDARGVPLGALAPLLAWTSRNAAVASVVEGRVTAVANGSTWVHAAAGALRDSVAVEMVQRATRVVIETPSPIAVTSVGETTILRARAYDRLNNEVQARTPTWRSLHPLIVHIEPQTGIATTLATGTATVTAGLDEASGTATVEVADVPVRVVLLPEAATLTSVGDTLLPTWTVYNARGAAMTGVAVSVASSDTTIIRTLADGRVPSVGTGTARLVASLVGGVADTALVTVVDAVAHVAITPDVATLTSVGDTVIPAASVRNERGAELPRSAASWTSDDAGVARVSAGGVVIAVGAGETIVRAASPFYPDRRDSLAVIVTNAPASVVIERDVDTMAAVGSSRTYAVEVRNARGALIASAADWRTLDPAIASVTSSGLVTSVGAGTARIIAAAGSMADTLVLTVRNDIVSLEALPAAVTLASLGDTFMPAVVARNALGAIIASPVIAWTSSNDAVARLQADGSVVAAGVGTSRIVGTAGALADTILVSVTNAPVVIDIAAAVDTIPAVGDSIVLAVTASNSRGDPVSTATLAWSVDDPVVARVGSSGTVTARAEGSTWVRASGGATQDSMLVVVTNEPGSIVLTLSATGAAAVLDTMTAAGQVLQYSAAVANLRGVPIPAASVGWQATDPSVVQVTSAGAVTALRTGSAYVIAAAGAVADSVRIVVIDPRRIYVDNAVVTSARFGTLARPYATIQDGVDAAGVDDTVIVHRGSGYSETVSIGRRMTLLGDSAAYVTAGRDPLLLPLLRHDLGAAGIITATPGASYTMRYLGIQHSVDGEAIVARDPDNLVLGDIYVNPVPGFRTGRGILVEGATGTVHISRSRVDSVYGFGIRIVNAGMATVDGATVRGVAARSGFSGAGIELVGGNGVVSGATVRRTAGPQVRFSRTTSASLIGSSLVGEQQLVRIDSASGSTVVRNNTFDLRYQAGEPLPVRGGAAADPSGLEILRSAGVLVDGNTFTDIGGQSSLMDAIRLADVRVATSGAAYGALLSGNRFRGGRTAVRSARATFTLSGSRVDSASTGVLLSDADSLVLVADTIAASRVAAVQSTGAAARVVMEQSLVTGAQRAVHVTGAASVTLRNNTITGTTFTGMAQPMLGAVDVEATAAEVVGNTISGIRGWAALALRGGMARADSNIISRNLAGVVLGVASAPGLAGNSIFDNDTLPPSARRSTRGVVNQGVARLLGANWWGAPEGPQSDLVAGSARGDSTIGGITTSSLLASPIAPHRGTGGAASFAALRKVAGDQQSGSVGASLLMLLTVRAVDAAGRPLSGATVTFRVHNSSGDFVTGSGTRADQGQNNGVAIVTDASGLAGAEYVPAAGGTATVTVSAGSGNTQASFTFTVNVP